MIEKFVIYLLKKPRMKAALKEIVKDINDLIDEDDIQERRKAREAVERKLLDDPVLYQDVLDDLYKNPTDFSIRGKFPASFYMAAISISNRSRDAERRTSH
ncbi:TIGR02678 family protein [Avibacterium sp. 20-126]|uniref:hypothetical protein n=1 Tax=Avibacterium sp. 20-126 TaxID=2911524 RepID=UPI002186F04D|nr:TIGR02678 family protein [Avibacterium sp. 20-126]